MSDKPLAEPRQVTPASMAADRRKFFARLEELGIASVTVEHEPMFTVEQSRDLRETIPGAHTKNLFLADKDGHVALVVAKHDSRVDLKRVAARLGFGRLSFGNAELLGRMLGVTPGSVTPFALINDKEARVRSVVDKRWSVIARSIVIRWRTPRRRGLPRTTSSASSAPAAMNLWSLPSPEADLHQLRNGFPPPIYPTDTTTLASWRGAYRVRKPRVNEHG